MTIAAALEQIAAALEAAGIHTGWADADVAAPVALLRIGAATDSGHPMAAVDRLTTVYVFWIPVRGAGVNSRNDAAALDQIFDALSPIAWDSIISTATTVMVGMEQWPCHRIDVTLLGQLAAAP